MCLLKNKEPKGGENKRKIHSVELEESRWKFVINLELVSSCLGALSNWERSKRLFICFSFECFDLKLQFLGGGKCF